MEATSSCLLQTGQFHFEQSAWTKCTDMLQWFPPPSVKVRAIIIATESGEAVKHTKCSNQRVFTVIKNFKQILDITSQANT